ncbi:MAG: hypothetical protein ACPF9Q_03160 [Opitutales bacterium]
METTENEPTEPAAERSLCLLPGHLFFIEGLELPEGLSEEEIPSFAELSLEANAPFPIEQLNWGYLCDREAGRLLYFATHQDRLKQAGYQDLESHTWVLPDFLALYGLNPGNGTHPFQSDLSHAKVSFGESPTVPDAIEAQPPEADRTSAPEGFELLHAEASEEEVVQFTLRAPGSETEQTVQMEAESLWAADVRPAEFKKNERRDRKLSHYLLQGFKYAACFAALLLIAELILLSANLWLNTREAKVASQASPVAKIQEQQALTVKLERVFDNQLRPVAMLEVLNNLRPVKSIHFNETSTEENNQVTIEGEATTVNALNAYIDQLKASGQIELLAEPKTLTRSGKTTFSVELGYLHREPEPTPPGEPAAAPDAPAAKTANPAEADADAGTETGAKPESQS